MSKRKENENGKFRWDVKKKEEKERKIVNSGGFALVSNLLCFS